MSKQSKQNKQTEYHVGASDISGLVYIGRATKEDGVFWWKDKSEGTSEAINAVMGHMLHKIKPGENSTAYMNTTRDGRYLRLTLEVADKKPEWLEEE